MEENLSGREKKKGLAIFKKKEIWISGIIGILIGAAIIYLLGILGVPGLGNETVATMKGGKISENNLYKEMKKYYPVTYLLELADSSILEKKYELTEEQTQEINDQVNLILTQYQAYGYTEETFLEENGFESKEEFVKYLELDYRRNLYCLDYFRTLIPTEDIQNYYNENEIYGEINTKHILVKVSNEVTEKEALTKANEILAKLNNGASFDEVATEYADSSTIITENVDFSWLNEESLAEEYVIASKTLEKDTYTKEAVLTDFGYHIIYCENKTEKPTFEEAENDIVEKLGANLEAEDQYIRYKALIKLREENNLKIKDSKYKEAYEEYCSEINEAEE
ncbi:MAG: peptidylprolyl isomerase [Clostridia bacterium]|nr:peptidylprolyl isomerase [Clostridia bacterium]